MNAKQFQTTKDVADLLKVGEPTVRRWIKNGELRAIDIGGEWRIAPDDLDRFLCEHATLPQAENTQHEEKQRKQMKKGKSID